MKLKKNNLWKKAIQIIPGGNMLYSKRAEAFLPDYWPTYFTKTKGCYVWSKDGNKYTDMIFAVGTNVLGYNNPILEKVYRNLEISRASDSSQLLKGKDADSNVSLNPAVDDHDQQMGRDMGSCEIYVMAGFQ